MQSWSRVGIGESSGADISSTMELLLRNSCLLLAFYFLEDCGPGLALGET